MEIKKQNKLQSTGYRSLFEYVEKEGVEPALNLVKDINNLPDKEILIKQTIMGERNALVDLSKKHKDIIKYLKENKDGFSTLNLQEDKVLNILNNLSNNITLLQKYLENARKLEELNVFKVDFIPLFDFVQFDYWCSIYRDENGNIIHINKYYSDGIIEPGKEILKDKLFNYSEIPLNGVSNATFLLGCENTEAFYQFRRIIIKDFDFDGSKLPSEEELQRYEIPKQLIKK